MTRLRYYFAQREIRFRSGPAISTFLLTKLYVEIVAPTLAEKYAELLRIGYAASTIKVITNAVWCKFKRPKSWRLFSSYIIGKRR